MDGFQDASAILRCGVYALRHREEVVYVGKSKRLLARIYAHKNLHGKTTPSWLPVRGVLFDEVWVKLCREDQLDEIEREMIERFKPKFNVRLKSPGPITVAIPLVVGGTRVVLNEPQAELRRL